MKLQQAPPALTVQRASLFPGGALDLELAGFIASVGVWLAMQVRNFLNVSHYFPHVGKFWEERTNLLFRYVCFCNPR